ncbi:HORMA domain-containing protein [Dunaliella salina]|uniref:HORMA domain-containing protein n=1 Tax=Dunaliella salina TaxID=3046 RepID=A0ABQ7GPP1_DUNSA|nr:HORMA domain-containing protein [Dunaliella salina]|eukprot:KAF5836577.1 HORMA domain-containing protein [Dunaliella salina]
MAPAQAQAQAQSTVTYTESLELVWTHTIIGAATKLVLCNSCHELIGREPKLMSHIMHVQVRCLLRVHQIRTHQNFRTARSKWLLESAGGASTHLNVPSPRKSFASTLLVLNVIPCMATTTTCERKSVFHISYLRGLFPDKFYKGVDMKNLEGMHIKMLQPCDEESQRLIDWVDAGVYDAIKVGYLKTLFFGVSTDPKGSSLLEEYIFNFSYGNGGVSMDVQQKTKSGTTRAMKASGSHQNDLEDVKYKVTRLMRMLVQICQTLEQMPRQRYLFMKLMYHENAPENYDPPFFKSLPESEGVGHFSRKPFSMSVGDVATKHHGVTLKVKSTLDCCGDAGGNTGDCCGDADGDTGVGVADPELVESANLYISWLPFKESLLLMVQDCCADADGDTGVVEPELVESANQQPSSSAIDQGNGTSNATLQQRVPMRYCDGMLRPNSTALALTDSDITMPDQDVPGRGSNAPPVLPVTQEQLQEKQKAASEKFQQELLQQRKGAVRRIEEQRTSPDAQNRKSSTCTQLPANPSCTTRIVKLSVALAVLYILYLRTCLTEHTFSQWTSKAMPEELYGSVKEYVLGCFESFSQVELVDVMGYFLDTHPNHIDAAFVRMQQEGILVADASRHDTFRPIMPKVTTSTAETAQAMMANLGVREDASQRGDIRALEGSTQMGLPTLDVASGPCCANDSAPVAVIVVHR